MPSSLDKLYRRLLITRFFEKGWGKPENLQRLFEFRKVISQREKCFKLVPSEYPIQITREEQHSDCKVLEGNFITPLELHMPGLVPKASQKAHFQVILPNKWTHERHKPMCIHLAGTGDHYFWRRRNFIAKPLLKEANIGGIILENPFYGVRKPDDQVRSNLHNVSDIFVMGGCLILECLVLLHWCERNGYGPLGVTGLSMGGHMASLAATNWPKPIVLVPCLSWSTASAVFTTGVMSHSINWDMLETQYFSDGQFSESLSKMVTVVDEAFAAGKKFVQNFSESMLELRQDIEDVQLNSSPYQTTTQKSDAPNVDRLSNKTFEKFTPEDKGKGTEVIYRSLTTACNAEKQSNKDARCTSTPQVKSKPTPPVKTPPSDSSREKSALTKLMGYILPRTTHKDCERIDITKTNWWEREALQFMRGMMDECTHLKNFSVPYDTSLIIAVCAKDDAYVPREGCSSLEEIWPGVEVRYLDAGHVSAYVLHQKLFRSTIIEAFERAKRKLDENASQGLVPEDNAIKPTITFEELRQRYEKAMMQC